MISLKDKIDWQAIKSEIYKNIYIPSVFEEALGIPFDLKKRYINPFRPSKSADSGFFRDKDDSSIYYFYDFVEGHRYDIFESIQLSYNLSFYEAINWLANTYSLWDKLIGLGWTKKSCSSSLRGSNMAYFNMIKGQKAELIRIAKEALETIPEKKAYGWSIEYPNTFNCEGYEIVVYPYHLEDHSDFWDKRGMNIPDNCFAVEAFISQSGKIIFRDWTGMPMFLFLGENESAQIYRPFADKKTKFRNLGSTEFAYIGGNKDYIIIEKGGKGFYELREMGFSVIAKAGESSKLNPDTYMFFKYKYLVMLMDNDPAGIKAAEKQIEYYNRFNINAISITIPKYIGKDVDDAVVKYGLTTTKKLIKNLIKKEIKKWKYYLVL